MGRPPVAAGGFSEVQKVEKIEIFKTSQNFTKTSKTLYKVVKSSFPALFWDSESSWGVFVRVWTPTSSVGGGPPVVVN